MSKYLKEIVLWLLVAIPIIYVTIIWEELPAQVPIHFNLEGQADGWAPKNSYLFLTVGLGIGLYILLLFIPRLDPKNKLAQMGSKYYSLRFIISLFISITLMHVLQSGQNGQTNNPSLHFVLIGGLFALMGNYFQTIKSNYFIGIRTPWTLESEQVWRKTHILGGRLWLLGGLLIILLAFFLNNKMILQQAFITIISALVIVPVLYSFIEFRKHKAKLV